jgi:type I restriction enzyme R subunit
MPPHPERQAAPGDEGDDAGRVFIGFTGTPLLKQDKQTSLEVFGGYIHTYKFSEAVEDGWCWTWCTRRATSTRAGLRDKIDAWFEAKTKGLNDWQKAELRKQWGTMQNVLSSRSRMDGWWPTSFSTSRQAAPEPASAATPSWWPPASTRPASTFELFQKTPFKGRARWSPPTTRRRRT